MLLRVDDDRQIEPLRVGPGEPSVSIRAPLHRRAHAVSVAEVEIIAHADLIAVIDHRSSG